MCTNSAINVDAENVFGRAKEIIKPSYRHDIKAERQRLAEG
jgi:hypothetical protein